MTEAALFAGPAMRRIRKRQSLTQAAMATALGISPSYLNLIERNQRPLSARVLVRVIDQFDFDPRSLHEDEAIGGVDGLARRLADERFANLAIDREEVDEFLSAAPHAAAAFARLYDQSGAGGELADDPMAACRREIERWRNHFADLDNAAEKLADEMRLSHGDVDAALVERLRERHQLSVRILPHAVMPAAIRRMDLHARQLQLSEMLDRSSRNFQIALQIALLEQRDAIAALVRGARLADDAARKLFERHLASYFAAAVLMPYGRFLRACDQTGYDLTILQRRFGVGFEQLAHRMTTLQRVGQRGLPFFMLRFDRAGQLSKRFSGASGATFFERDTLCPLWSALRAFERPGEWCVEAIDVDGVSAGGAHWISIARTVEASGAPQAGRFVVVLGLEARLAANLAQARHLALGKEDATPVGMGCRRCHRPDCRQRALPPENARLTFDTTQRGIAPFEFG